MKNLLDFILLKDKLILNTSSDNLKNKLNNSEGRKYDVVWLSETEFKFISHWTIGSTFESVKGYGIINENKLDNKIEIELCTKIRNENYLIIGLFIFFFLCAIMTNETLPIWVAALLPISLVWFWGIFRIQENYLFKSVKKHLTTI